MMKPTRAKTRSSLTALTVLLGLLTACTSTSQDTTTTSQPAPGQTTQPAPGGTTQPAPGESGVLVVNQRFQHTAADPHREGTAHGRTVFRPVYEALTHFDSPDVSEAQPLLAESWESNADATVWTFTLQEDAVFSDGTPVTADDVVFSLRRFKHLAGPFSFLLTGIEVTQGGSDREVVLTSEATNVAIPFLVSYPHMAIVNAEVVRANGGTDGEDAATTDTAAAFFEQESVGTGPYVFGTFSTTTNVEYVANENYWGEPPAYERIVYVNAQPQTALLNIQLGRADLILDVTAESLSALDTTGLQVVQGTSPIVWYLLLNLNPEVSEVTSNANLQEAIRVGLNYDSMGELFGPAAIRACGIIPRSVFGSLNEDDCVAGNLAEAQALLQASGVENPTIELEFISDFNIEGVNFVTVAERLQSQLTEIGFEVSLRASPIGTQIQRYASQQVEAHVWSISMRHPDVSSYVQALTFGANAAATAWAPGDLPEIEALGSQILSATSDAEREPLIRQWQELLNESGPYITLFQGTRTLVGSDQLSGVESHPLYFIDLTRITPGG